MTVRHAVKIKPRRSPHAETSEVARRASSEVGVVVGLQRQVPEQIGRRLCYGLVDVSGISGIGTTG
jgi:hypothetical protein